MSIRERKEKYNIKLFPNKSMTSRSSDLKSQISPSSNVAGHGQRPDRGCGDHHQPHHHRLLLPALRGLRVVPGPLQ